MIIVPSNVVAAQQGTPPTVLGFTEGTTVFPAHSVGDMLLYVGWHSNAASPLYGFTTIQNLGTSVLGYYCRIGYRVATDTSYTATISLKTQLCIVLSPCTFTAFAGTPNYGSGSIPMPEPGGPTSPSSTYLGLSNVSGNGLAPDYEYYGNWTLASQQSNGGRCLFLPSEGVDTSQGAPPGAFPLSYPTYWHQGAMNCVQFTSTEGA